MTNITIDSSSKVFTNVQTLVLYQDGFGYPYPFDEGILAESTDVDNLTYSAGRLMAQYSEANAPDPALVGAFVNYDPASANVDQQTCVGIIPTGYYDLTGIDLTTTATSASTINRVNICRLLAGVSLYEATIIAQNTEDVVTGFNTDLAPALVTQVWMNGVQSNIIAIK